MKSVQIRGFIWSECGKYGPEKTQYFDTFHGVTSTKEKYQILKFGLKYGLVIRPNKSRVLAYAEDAWKVKYLPK